MPVPLLDPGHSLMILWSAKSACSLTFVWYLSLVGLLEDFISSGMSPHEYRGRRYRTSEAFRRGRAKMIDDYRIVHVIRDPYQRAVSSYRHVLATGLADKRLGTLGGSRLDRISGFPFTRYLDFLETLDIEGTNLHHRQQLHSMERSKQPDRVINISKENFLDALDRLEGDLGLPRTDFSKLGPVLREEEKRRARTTTFDTDRVPDLPLNAAAACGEAPWPDYGQFLTADVRQRIERLYAVDFRAFGPYL